MRSIIFIRSDIGSTVSACYDECIVFTLWNERRCGGAIKIWRISLKCVLRQHFRNLLPGFSHIHADLTDALCIIKASIFLEGMMKAQKADLPKNEEVICLICKLNTVTAINFYHHLIRDHSKLELASCITDLVNLLFPPFSRNDNSVSNVVLRGNCSSLKSYINESELTKPDGSLISSSIIANEGGLHSSIKSSLTENKLTGNGLDLWGKKPKRLSSSSSIDDTIDYVVQSYSMEKNDEGNAFPTSLLISTSDSLENANWSSFNHNQPFSERRVNIIETSKNSTLAAEEGEVFKLIESTFLDQMCGSEIKATLEESSEAKNREETTFFSYLRLVRLGTSHTRTSSHVSSPELDSVSDRKYKRKLMYEHRFNFRVPIKFFAENPVLEDISIPEPMSLLSQATSSQTVLSPKKDSTMSCHLISFKLEERDANSRIPIDSQETTIEDKDSDPSDAYVVRNSDSKKVSKSSFTHLASKSIVKMKKKIPALIPIRSSSTFLCHPRECKFFHMSLPKISGNIATCHMKSVSSEPKLDIFTEKSLINVPDFCFDNKEATSKHSFTFEKMLTPSQELPYAFDGGFSWNNCNNIRSEMSEKSNSNDISENGSHHQKIIFVKQKTECCKNKREFLASTGRNQLCANNCDTIENKIDINVPETESLVVSKTILKSHSKASNRNKFFKWKTTSGTVEMNLRKGDESQITSDEINFYLSDLNRLKTSTQSIHAADNDDSIESNIRTCSPSDLNLAFKSNIQKSNSNSAPNVDLTNSVSENNNLNLQSFDSLVPVSIVSDENADLGITLLNPALGPDLILPKRFLSNEQSVEKNTVSRTDKTSSIRGTNGNVAGNQNEPSKMNHTRYCTRGNVIYPECIASVEQCIKKDVISGIEDTSSTSNTEENLADSLNELFEVNFFRHCSNGICENTFKKREKSAISNSCGIVDPKSHINSLVSTPDKLRSVPLRSARADSNNNSKYEPSRKINNHKKAVNTDFCISSRDSRIGAESCEKLDSSLGINSNDNGEGEKNIISSTDPCNRRFHCSLCDRSYSKKNHLLRHLRMHANDRRYQCNICSKRFTTNAILKQHSRLHSGERPFVCRVCGKSFSQKSSLSTHSMLHTGKRFKCFFCQYAFVSNHKLMRHITKHDMGDSRMFCHICKSQFITAGTFNQHLVNAHNYPPKKKGIAIWKNVDSPTCFKDSSINDVG